MSKLKRRGNIEQTIAYDPFPKTGLVAQYKPAILKEVGKYIAKYPGANFDHALAEAVRLAMRAEERFKPELGNSFWTFLQPHLKGLNRFIQQELGEIVIPLTEEEKAAEEREAAEEAGEPTRPVIFKRGNGCMSASLPTCLGCWTIRRSPRSGLAGYEPPLTSLNAGSAKLTRKLKTKRTVISPRCFWSRSDCISILRFTKAEGHQG
jgi:hypothetical protein